MIVYNVQRLFRPVGGRVARALDATPKNGWTRAAYNRKVEAVGAVLTDCTGGPKPAFVVLLEIEDHIAVADVLAAAGWPDMINVAVPGEQIDGYDVAIAYDPALFTGVAASESHNFNNRFATRDLLMANLMLADGTELTVCGTHWASRSMIEGTPLRFAAAAYCSRLVEDRLKYSKDEVIAPSGNATLPSRSAMMKRWMTPVVFAGDLNDGPWDTTVRTLVDSTPELSRVQSSPRLPRGTNLRSAGTYLSLRPRLYNPTWYLLGGDGPMGTYVFGGEWTPLDQLLVSSGLMTANTPRYIDGSLHAHAPRSVTPPSGSRVTVTTSSNTPVAFDAATGKGASDHLPLVATFEFA